MTNQAKAFKDIITKHASSDEFYDRSISKTAEVGAVIDPIKSVMAASLAYGPYVPLAIGGVAGLGAMGGDMLMKNTKKKIRAKEEELQKIQNIINDLKHHEALV